MHFVLSVLSSDNGPDYETLLEPFNEHLEMPVYKKYDDVSHIAQTLNIVPINIGEITADLLNNAIKAWNSVSYHRQVALEGNKIISNDVEKINFTLKTLVFAGWKPIYSDEDVQEILNYYNGYIDADDIEKHGYGYDQNGFYYMTTYNPNSKWDWYEVGGRWSNMLVTKDGKTVNSAKLKNLDWNAYKEHIKMKRKDEYQKLLENIKNGMPKKSVKSFCGVNHLITEEEYINQPINFSTYAALLPDGNWHERDLSDNNTTVEQLSKEWGDSFFDRFIKDADPELTLTIVDCHI